MGIFYNTDKNQKYNFIHAYLPKAEFDEIIEQKKNNRIFVRCGDAYAMLRFSNTYTWVGSTEIKVYDPNGATNFRIGVVCEAGDKAEYGSFEKFIAAMEEKEFKFDMTNLTLDYDNMRLTLDDDGKTVTEYHYIDDAEQSYHYNYTYDSPFMVSEWDSGVITVTIGKKVRIMDFMNITDTTTKK
jgi:hypothetical protein